MKTIKDHMTDVDKINKFKDRLDLIDQLLQTTEDAKGNSIEELEYREHLIFVVGYLMRNTGVPSKWY